MSNLPTKNKQPYDFGRSIFLPFQSGPGSAAFVLKSAFFYALALTVFFALFGRMLIGPMEDFIVVMMEIESVSEEEELAMVTKMFGAMGRVILPCMLIMLGGWAIWAMIESALHRRVLLDERPTGLFPWRFGADEWRTILAQLILYMCYQGLYFVVYIVFVMGILLAVLMGSASVVLGVVGGIVAFGLIAAGVGLMVWVLVRLAPTAALSVANGEFAIGEAWPVVKGRIWPTVGAYAFHYIIGSIVFYFVMAIVGVAFVGSIMGKFTGLSDNSSGEEVWQLIRSVFSEPGTLVGLTIAGFILFFIAAIWMLLIAGISTHVTDLYKRDLEAAGVEVFD